MEYHYQWPEYLDPTSPEGSGWESICASPPPFCADTPAMPSCMPRVFPRGRPMRRRRLFPPPFNHFARGVRPQWSTPYYDCRYKWSREPHGTKVCSPQFDTCCDYESLLDKTTTDKPPPTPAKKVRKSKGSSQQSKPVQVVRNSDQPLPECNSPSGAVPIGHQSSPLDPLCKSPEYQESSQSTLISVCNNGSIKSKSSQVDYLRSSVKVSSEGSEKYYAENGKDMLTSILNRTIFEESNDLTNNYQHVTDSHRNQLEEEPIEPCQGSCLINNSSDPSQNVTAGNLEFFGSSQNKSKNSYCDELFYNGSLSNFPNEISKETELAVFNLQQVEEYLDSVAQDPTRYGDQKFSSNEQNVCNEAKTNNSLVVYDPLKPQQSVDGNITVESENNVNTAEVKSSSNAQFSKDNNSHPCSLEKEDSISSLIQQNQLLSDLLSHLISGEIDFQKDLFASNQLLPETGNITSEVQTNLTEGSIAECSSLQTVSKEDPVNILQNVPVTQANMPAELPLPSLHVQEISVSNYSNEPSMSINGTNNPKFSDKLTKACEVAPDATINKLVLQESDVSAPTETLPSNIDYPSSDSETNLREATLSSVTNYLLEEPLERFPDSLISIFDDEISLQMLSSCVKPNSVLKVKKPRKRYVKSFQSIKVKKKEKTICKKSSKCKELSSKCLKMIRKCKHKICKEERGSSKDYTDSHKELRDVEVQVGESDLKTTITGKVSKTSDVGTQCEVLENQCKSIQEAISFKKDRREDYKCSNHIVESNRTLRETDEQPYTKEQNNLIRNEDVLVMLVEIPLNLKNLSMETRNLKVEIVDNNKMQVKTSDMSQMTSNRGRIIQSLTKISDPKTENFAVSYDIENKQSAKSSVSKIKECIQDKETSRSDHTGPISKPHKSNDLTKENSHATRKLREIQRPKTFKKTPDVYSGSDRILRKRKTVNYSDPGPSKRKRFNSVESEVEFVNDKSTKKAENRNLDTNVSTADSNCRSRSNMLLRNRNLSEFLKDKQREQARRKEQHNKSQRPKTG